MKFFSNPYLGRGVCIYLLWLSTTYSFSQTAKEDRNYYPRAKKTEKIRISAHQTPFLFSPHLPYKEQKKIQMARKQVGGITFTIKRKRESSRSLENYKRPNLLSKSGKNLEQKRVIADTSKPYIRYEFPDSTSK